MRSSTARFTAKPAPPLAAGVHHFQILTTNGKLEPSMPL